MTLTAVGYGDIYPVTLAGRLVAVVTTFCGLVLFGLLMDIVGKTMMVALFGNGSVDEEQPANPPCRDQRRQLGYLLASLLHQREGLRRI